VDAGTSYVSRNQVVWRKRASRIYEICKSFGHAVQLHPSISQFLLDSAGSVLFYHVAADSFRACVITIARATDNADESQALIPEIAIPISGGPPRTICPGPCTIDWSPDRKWFYVTVVRASRTDAGKTIALPIPPGQSLPNLPAAGIGSLEQGLAIPGARLIAQADIIPGADFGTYAYVRTAVHRNLFRIALPR
jgi:hypothetical protein